MVGISCRLLHALGNEAMERPNTSVRPILSALWATMMFLYVYADVLSLYRPGVLDEIRDGEMGPLDVSQFTLVAAATMVIVPALMIFLSLILPSRASRWANISAGVVFTLVNISNLIGETWVYYWMFGLLEIVATLLIVRYAWKIPNVRDLSSVQPAMPANFDLAGTSGPLL